MFVVPDGGVNAGHTGFSSAVRRQVNLWLHLIAGVVAAKQDFLTEWDDHLNLFRFEHEDQRIRGRLSPSGDWLGRCALRFLNKHVSLYRC